MTKFMKIALVHNTYQQCGGEDVVVTAESTLLERNGHKVIRYSRSNEEIQALSGPEQLFLVKNIIHSEKSKQDLYALLRAEKPEVVHVHNTFMMISPSVYEACRDAGIPVVQTLHNYRLLCPGWSLSRNGKVCEECIDDGLWRSVWHGCYRDSRLMSAAVALMLQVHRTKGTWEHAVNGYVALTNFAREKFIQGGLPASTLHVKPNFVESDPGERSSAGRTMLFIGRLSVEKGIDVLLKAWQQLAHSIPLVVVGDGPLRPALEAEVAAKSLSNITFAGWRSRAEIFAALKNASIVIVPSVCYEGFPMALVEAFACGTPVLGSNLGGVREIVKDGHNGLHFQTGDAGDLASKVEWAWSQPAALAAMGRAARQDFKQLYTAETNYKRLMQIYEKAIAHAATN
jgi:glycosyltransferase involved in cell wall biosynthesis